MKIPIQDSLGQPTQDGFEDNLEGTSQTEREMEIC